MVAVVCYLLFRPLALVKRLMMMVVVPGCPLLGTLALAEGLKSLQEYRFAAVMLSGTLRFRLARMFLTIDVAVALLIVAIATMVSDSMWMLTVASRSRVVMLVAVLNRVDCHASELDATSAWMSRERCSPNRDC